MSVQIEFLKRCKALGLHDSNLPAWLDEIESLRMQIAELKAENERLKPRHEAHVKMLGELLAVLHADGGHYQYEHGTEKAVEDSITKYYELKRQLAELQEWNTRIGVTNYELRKELAEYKAENERLNTVPMKYRRMAFNAQLQKENEDLQFRNDRLVQDFADVTEENDALRRIHAENIEIFKRQLAEYKALLSNLMEVVEEPPKRNCSCHISPPCSDCVEWSGLREALSEARTAMKGAIE